MSIVQKGLRPGAGSTLQRNLSWGSAGQLASTPPHTPASAGGAWEDSLLPGPRQPPISQQTTSPCSTEGLLSVTHRPILGVSGIVTMRVLKVTANLTVSARS